MALRAGYYGVKRFLRNNLERIAGTYDETIKSLFPRSEQTVLGAKNLLRETITTYTTNGVTFTLNEDGSITVNGTATGETYAPVFSRDYAPELAKGRYIVSGGVARTSDYTFYLQERNADNTDWGRTFYDETGNGVLYERTTDVRYSVFINIKNGKTINNLTFYPMIRLATDPDDTYAPYAMTNRELTDSAAEQKTAINALITAATSAADFAAFKTAMGAITPVTRSLSLTKEDITEEVKEDVEPEKTVTKKRTTKKTEEV